MRRSFTATTNLSGTKGTAGRLETTTSATRFRYVHNESGQIATSLKEALRLIRIPQK